MAGSVKPLSRLLVPVDFSAVTYEQLHIAENIARKYNAEIILVHVIEEGLVEHVIAGYNVADLVPHLEKAAKEKLLKIADELREHGVNAQVYEEMPVADPAVAISNIAKEVNASEVIIASKGWGWRRLLTAGSTSRLVVKLSSIPVILLRASKKETNVTLYTKNHDIFRTILYAYRPEHPKSAVDYLFEIARKANSEVIVFYAPEERDDETKVRLQIEDLIKEFEYAGIKAERIILSGTPWKLIISAAEASEATSIFLGRSVSKSLSEYILGSTIDRLVGTTSIPLIIYPL